MLLIHCKPGGRVCVSVPWSLMRSRQCKPSCSQQDDDCRTGDLVSMRAMENLGSSHALISVADTILKGC